MDFNDYCNSKAPNRVRALLDEGNAENTIMDTMVDELKRQFPDQNNLKAMVRVLLDMAKAGRLEVNDSFNTTNHTTVNLTINIAPAKAAKRAKKKAQKTLKIVFRLINDQRLSLTDRIIYSLLWTHSWVSWKNRKNRAEKKPSINRIHKATGLRDTTIAESIRVLKEAGLIDENLKPYPNSAQLMRNKDGKALFRKLAWSDNDLGIRENVFNAFVATCNPKRTYSAGYFTRCLGIGRATYFRWLASATPTTDETTPTTDETP